MFTGLYGDEFFIKKPGFALPEVLSRAACDIRLAVTTGGGDIATLGGGVRQQEDILSKGSNEPKLAIQV